MSGDERFDIALAEENPSTDSDVANGSTGKVFVENSQAEWDSRDGLLSRHERCGFFCCWHG